MSVPPMDNWSYLEAIQIDADLRTVLKGVRFIGELDLELDGDAHSRARSVIQPLLERQRFRFIGDFPAALCIYLVAQGRHGYRQGAFWDQLNLSTPLMPVHQTKIGSAYLSALSQLGLETFDEVTDQLRALKYVTPILLHGGIPEDATDELWTVLVAEFRKGIFDAEELQNRLGVHGVTSYLLPQPVRRFHTYGGAYARDLLARMIDLSETFSISELVDLNVDARFELSRKSGVPDYILRGLSKLEVKAVDRPTRITRPQLKIDAYGGEGPVLILPVIPRGLPPVIFRIHDGSTRVVHGSTIEALEIPVSPNSEWRVSCEYGGVTRSWEFVGIPNGRALLFDDSSGVLLRNQRQVTGTQVLALVEKGVRGLDATSGLKIPVIETCADLNGAWQSWELQRIDLSNSLRFIVPIPGQEQEAASIVIVNKSKGLVQPLSRPLHGVTGQQGQVVYDHIPKFLTFLDSGAAEATRLRWRDRDGAWLDLPNNPVNENGELVLDNILSADGFFDGEILLRGHLGSDVRESFAIVPGLVVDLPDEPLISPEPVVIEGLVGQIVGSEVVPKPFTLEFASNQSRQTVSIGRELHLSFSIPRVSWSLRLSGETLTLDNKIADLAFDEILSGKAESLVVKTGVPAQVALEFFVRDKMTRRSEFITTSQDSGRWSFSLAQFIDDVNHATEAEISIRLSVNAKTVEVARVFATYEVSNVRVHALESVSAESGAVRIRVEWQENKRFASRVVRLWSLTRPWELPYEISVENETNPVLEAFVGEGLVPGKTLAEVTIRDEWRRTTRPRLISLNTYQFTLGSRGLVSDREERLDPTNFLNRLELLLRGRHDSLEEVEPIEAVEYSSEIAATFELLASDVRGNLPIDSKPFNILIRLVGKELGLLSEVLTQFQIHYPQRFDEFVLDIVPRSKSINQDDLLVSDRDRLWVVSEVLGGVMDALSESAAIDRNSWNQFTGWPINDTGIDQENEEAVRQSWGLPYLGFIDRQFSQMTFERLKELLPYMPPIPLSMQRPLAYGGFFEAVAELLKLVASDPEWLRDFIKECRSFSAVSGLSTDKTRSFYEAHTPERMSEPHAVIPQLLLMMCLHLLRGKETASQCLPLLAEAQDRLPLFTRRSLLLACSLMLLEKDPLNVIE